MTSTALDRPLNYSCPYCEDRKIETATRAPYVRGFLLAYQVGVKRFIGCTTCVRGKLLKEVGISSLIGWFSITAVLLNPVFIIFNLIRVPFIRINYAKARKRLDAAGIPDDRSQVDVTQLGYSLAASMMAADGNIDEKEIDVALRIGQKIFSDFDEAELRSTLARAKTLPSPQDIATLLREVLTNDGKRILCSYLWAIAEADGTIDESEKQLLTEVTDNIGLEAETAKADT